MAKLRLIQAGVGGMGRTWWTTATGNSPDFELMAIADISPDALQQAGDALGIPQSNRFESLVAALSCVQANAVLTVTPPAIHLEHAKLAFSRGLHLLTEKPIAHDLGAATQMVELARRAGRELMVAQNYRYSAPMTALRRLVSQKSLGELGHGHIDFYMPADFTGTFRETMQYPLLVDMAIHHLDLIRAVTGRNIHRVTAHTFNPAWSWYQHDAGLKMLMTLEGNLPFSYSGDWSAHGRATSWNGTWRLQCEHGSIHLEDDKLTMHRNERWNKKPQSEGVEIPSIALNGQQVLLQRFAEAIRTGEAAETCGEDNLWSFGAVMRAIDSAANEATMLVGSRKYP